VPQVITENRRERAVNPDGIDAYRTSQVTGSSPARLVLLLYDHVIKCLKSGDSRGASKGIVELMGSLDLDYQEVSGRLFSLYEYCLDLVKKGEHEQAGKIMTEMRHMWDVAMKQMASEDRAGEAVPGSTDVS
jgi:flagellin-specific chaperone FliS